MKFNLPLLSKYEIEGISKDTYDGFEVLMEKTIGFNNVVEILA